MFKVSGFSLCVLLGLLFITAAAVAQGPWIMEYYAMDPVRGTADIASGRTTDWMKTIFGIPEATMALRAPSPTLKGKHTITGEDGSVAFDAAAGKYTVKAGGADIWGTADAFRFTYKEMKGDFAIAMKAVSLDKTNDWSKIGPMVRQNNKAGSQYLFMLARGLDGNKYFQERMTEGGSATGNGGTLEDKTGFPIWLRITRKGNDYTGAYSADGKTWKDLGKTTLALKDPILVGIAVTSHASKVIANAVATDVTIDGKAVPLTDMKSEDIGTIKTQTFDIGWAVGNLKDTKDSNNLSKGIYGSKYGADLNNFVFYGFVGVISPKAQDTVLNLAQDDDGVVWIGGKKVVESVGWTGGAETTKPFNVHLEKGMNAMMVKVSEGTGGDYLNIRFNATDLTFTPKGGAFDFSVSVSPAGKLTATWGAVKELR